MDPLFYVADIVTFSSQQAKKAYGEDATGTIIQIQPQSGAVVLKHNETGHTINIHWSHLKMADPYKRSKIPGFGIGDRVIFKGTGWFGEIIDIGEDLIDVEWDDDHMSYRTHPPEDLEVIEIEDRFDLMMED